MDNGMKNDILTLSSLKSARFNLLPPESVEKKMYGRHLITTESFSNHKTGTDGGEDITLVTCQ